MTTLLQNAVTKAQRLPPPEQDALAQMMIEEMEGEAKWEAVLAKSPEKLAKLSDQAWAEHEAGGTRPLNLDQL
jgi:hypothetical protein